MNLRKTNQQRIAVIYSKADEGMDNRGKDMRGDGTSDCSKARQVEIGRSSEISHVMSVHSSPYSSSQVSYHASIQNAWYDGRTLRKEIPILQLLMLPSRRPTDEEETFSTVFMDF